MQETNPKMTKNDEAMVHDDTTINLESAFEFAGIKAYQAVQQDVPALTQLINESFWYQDEARGRTRIDERELHYRMRSDLFYIFKDHAEIVGCVTLYIDNQCLHFGLLAVRQDRRGTGLAQAIIAAVEAVAKAGGYTDLYLSYMADVAPGLKAYYEQYGFEETGEQYTWQGLQIRDMRKALSQA